MAYGDVKDLIANKILRNKACSIAKNLKYDGYQRDLASIVYKFLTLATRNKSAIKDKNIPNKKLAEEIWGVDIWGKDLADTQLIRESNKGFRFLFCIIDHFSKYAWVISLKNKKDITIISNDFQKILNESHCKSKKILVAQHSEFYNRSMKSWLKKNAVELYSIYYEGKSVVAKRFIGNSKKIKFINT